MAASTDEIKSKFSPEEAQHRFEAALPWRAEGRPLIL